MPNTRKLQHAPGRRAQPGGTGRDRSPKRSAAHADDAIVTEAAASADDDRVITALGLPAVELTPEMRKYEATINDAGLDRAFERAQHVRASADSAKAANTPKSQVPIPGMGEPGGAAPPAGPPPAGADSKTPPPAKKP